MLIVLPARLPDARDLPVQSLLPETDPAEAEFPNVGAGTTTAVAAVNPPRAELRLPFRLLDQRLLRHLTLL